MTYRVGLFSALALLAVLQRPVRAQTPQESDARALDFATKAFNEGVKRTAANDFEGARILFAESYAARPSTSALKNLAIMEVATSRYVEAATHLREYAASSKADPEFVAHELPDFVRQCNEHLGHVHVLAPGGSVVLLDGKKVDASEDVDVLPGEHTLALRDVPDRSSKVWVPVQSTVEANLLPPAPLPPPPAPPPTRVLRSPPTQAQPRPAVAPLARTDTHDNATSFWSTQHVLALSLTGASVVAFGISLGAGVASNNNKGDYNTLNAEQSSSRAACFSGNPSIYCASLRSAVSSQQSDAHLATGAFVVGAALGVGALVTWLWPSSSDRREQSAVRIAPAVSPRGTGIFAQGQF